MKQSMKLREGVPAPPLGSSKDKKPAPPPPPRPVAQQKFRPADDNETVNEVVSNWGAAQAMLQKREGKTPVGSAKDKKPIVPSRPPPRPMGQRMEAFQLPLLILQKLTSKI
ncbi:unnamed protein product [Strongylus vulgaris]|uniref:Uncharacterized protein n=1 Tax=Strongylus vulgaris TaxID=40348 RepID=A0A3P7M118_STRVU|nr:unnamed protein product [Strongylus vulgaris]